MKWINWIKTIASETLCLKVKCCSCAIHALSQGKWIRKDDFATGEIPSSQLQKVSLKVVISIPFIRFPCPSFVFFRLLIIRPSFLSRARISIVPTLELSRLVDRSLCLSGGRSIDNMFASVAFSFSKLIMPHRDEVTYLYTEFFFKPCPRARGTLFCCRQWRICCFCARWAHQHFQREIVFVFFLFALVLPLSTLYSWCPFPFPLFLPLIPLILSHVSFK